MKNLHPFFFLCETFSRSYYFSSVYLCWWQLHCLLLIFYYYGAYIFLVFCVGYSTFYLIDLIYMICETGFLSWNLLELHDQLLWHSKCNEGKYQLNAAILIKIWTFIYVGGVKLKWAINRIWKCKCVGLYKTNMLHTLKKKSRCITNE